MTSEFPFKSTPLSSLLLITLLGVFTVMLIVPEIDPPGTGFQTDGFPLTVHGLAHHAPHGKTKNDAIQVPFRVAEASNRAHNDRSTREAMGVPAVPERILRC